MSIDEGSNQTTGKGYLEWKKLQCVDAFAKGKNPSVHSVGKTSENEKTMIHLFSAFAPSFEMSSFLQNRQQCF